MPKKLIDLNDDDVKFLSDYKESHGVTSEAFIRLAIQEKIIKVKAELKLKENVSNK